MSNEEVWRKIGKNKKLIYLHSESNVTGKGLENLTLIGLCKKEKQVKIVNDLLNEFMWMDVRTKIVKVKNLLI